MTADASLPGSGFFVPDDYAARHQPERPGWARRRGFSRRHKRPIVDADLTTHSQLGSGWAPASARPDNCSAATG